MNIRITRLSMTNFKCFREKELSLDEDIITIRGRNGAGKTTIADAILFCLFGKNSEGQSDLELFKTRENGKVKPNIDHSVELVLETSAKDDATFEVTLRRSIKEVWVKKRGSDESVFKNNTVEYFVNGESYTKADYEKYIASLVDERVFRAITNPNYFPSLKWQDQRNFLTAMIGSIDPECFADTDDLKSLVDYFDQHDEDIESYLKHLKYQIKQIKDKLGKIPVRLEEQNKALPERLDWDALKVERDAVTQQLKDIESKIASIQQGNGADIQREELRKQISEVNQKLSEAKQKIINEVGEKNNSTRQAISNIQIKFNEELNNQKLMEQTIDADKRLIEKCVDFSRDCDKEIERLRLAWPNRKFGVTEPIDDSIVFCPTCGQRLPDDEIDKKVNEMRENFNKELEAEKQSLRDKAAKVKKEKEDSDKEYENLTAKYKEDFDSLEAIKQRINTIFSEKAKLEKQGLIDQETVIAEDRECIAWGYRLKELQIELVKVTDSDNNIEQLAALNQQRSEYVATQSQLQLQLATRQQCDRILALIDGINEEQKDLVRQLSELEKKEDIARQYQFRQNQLLEERINQHFKLVQWKLFRTVNNGGDSFEEPFCECYVNGIPYHAGLNQAARLNAGLDIINALCKFYNVAAPICLDNSESCINIMQTAGQQVRLQVTDTDLQLV